MWGIDSAPLAIRKAQDKAARRGLPVHFQVLDALELSRLNRKSDKHKTGGVAVLRDISGSGIDAFVTAGKLDHR